MMEWGFEGFCCELLQYKLAVCQLSVTSDKDANIAHAREKIEASADKGAQLIVLPVNSQHSPSPADCFRRSSKLQIVEAEEAS